MARGDGDWGVLEKGVTISVGRAWAAWIPSAGAHYGRERRQHDARVPSLSARLLRLVFVLLFPKKEKKDIDILFLARKMNNKINFKYTNPILGSYYHRFSFSYHFGPKSLVLKTTYLSSLFLFEYDL